MKKPFNRPGSAKSTTTRITLDSQIATKDLNNSKFSQTFTNGVKNNDQKNNEFAQYVAEKNKDPKFKKYLEPNLPKIPEKVQKKQVSNIASKPFQKRNSKMDKYKKIQQPPQKEQYESKGQQNLSNSSFAQKVKKKMSSLKVSENQDSKKQKPKINFQSFTVNGPRKSKILIKKQSSAKKQQYMQQREQIKRQTKTKQTQQEQLRRQHNLQLSRFIQQVQTKNIDYYPEYYDQFLQQSNTKQIDKIDINQYLKEPTENDYAKMRKRVQNYDKRIETEEMESSINLDDIIDNQSNVSNDIVLNQMSASQLQKRNVFLTQILKGKITKEQIEELQSMDKSSLKLMKLDEGDKQKDDNDDDIEIVQVDMRKNKHTRIMQRNRVEASGKIYRDCDYLSQQHKKRLQQLLNGDLQQSPFQYDEESMAHLRQLNQNIQRYRELTNANQQQDQNIIYEDSLPKDPTLRKQAQLKILKQKVKSVNERLKQVDNVIISSKKIQSIVEKYKHTKLSRMSEQLLKEKRKSFQQSKKLKQEAEQIINNAIKNRELMEQQIDILISKYNNLETQIIQLREMSTEEYKKLKLDELKAKKKQIQEIEVYTENFSSELESFEQITQQIQYRMRILDQISNSPNINLNYENYDPNETIDLLDKMITERWQAAENITQQISDHMVNQ